MGSCYPEFIRNGYIIPDNETPLFSRSQENAFFWFHFENIFLFIFDKFDSVEVFKEEFDSYFVPNNHQRDLTRTSN